MNWRIIEISCNCELQSFLTWELAYKYFFEKRLDKNIYDIVPAGKMLDLVLQKARGHNILELINFNKSEPYKDFIKKEHVIETVKDAFSNFKTPFIKRLRRGNEKRRYLVFLKTNNEIIIKQKNNSDQHRTNLKDLCTK